jgi:thiol-disulfide isomerase/thioredoxin
MKKTIQIIALATLCLFFSIVVEGQTVALKVGDKVPDVEINHVSNYKSRSLKLSDFKGKLLILDFWATWCSPCIMMMPKMEKIQFLPVTYQTESAVKPFLERLSKQDAYKNLKLPKVTRDTVLSKLFPYVYLPHYVWINENGTLLGTTSYDKITEANITTALSGQSLNVAQKKDIRVPYDIKKPLLIPNNGLQAGNIKYQSVFSGYIEGIGAGYTIAKSDSIQGERISARNEPLSRLFRLAYSEGKRYIGSNRLIINVKDPSRLTNKTKASDEYKSWMAAGNGYCYELIVNSPKIDRYKIMQGDLKRFFPEYDAKLEYQKVKCLVLVRTSPEVKIASSGGSAGITVDATGISIKNSYLNLLMTGLYSYFFQGSSYQLMNETGLTVKADITINGDASDISTLNRELEK